MLSRTDYQKLGVPYVNQGEESDKINYFASTLNSKLESLRNILPNLVSVPESSQSNGAVGSIAVDADYIYVCTETNLWKRISLKEL